MDNENIYDKIQELFGNIPNSFNILEEQIDIDLQMEYFEFSKKNKQEPGDDAMGQLIRDISNADLPIEVRKKYFVQLASMENVEAYRAIEKYLGEPEEALKDWATLALQESRMLLESRLLDTNQVFISTGLGGRGYKLRYFVVFISEGLVDLNKTQKRVIRAELKEILEKSRSEVEEIDFEGPYSSFYAYIPLNVSINDLFDKVIAECNFYGDFLKQNFIITNVKALTYKEIDDFIKKPPEIDPGE